MLGLMITLALLAALAVSGRRLWRRSQFSRRVSRLPGGSLATALAVESFEDIDDHLRRRECPCGGLYQFRGEGARVEGDTRYRVVRVECMRCERDFSIYFDVTRLFQ